MTKPPLSVIIPTFNRAALACEAVDSVLRQGFRALEIIVVDHGSSDDTKARIHAIQDSRIRYLYAEPGGGPARARNAGFRASDSEFIAFLDADDLWAPHKLTRQLEAFRIVPEADIVFSDCWNSNLAEGNRDRCFRQAREGLRTLKTEPVGEGVYKILDKMAEGLLRKSFILTPSTVLMRRSMRDRLGDFDESLLGTEDFEYWWRASLLGAVFAYVDEPLVERRKVLDSLSLRPGQFGPQLLRCYDACARLAEDRSRPDLLPAIRRASLGAWAGILRGYAYAGLRREALAAYRRSLEAGLGASTLIWLLAALAGPRPLRWARRLRASRSAI